jgi:Cu+-exporting ATPase
MTDEHNERHRHQHHPEHAGAGSTSARSVQAPAETHPIAEERCDLPIEGMSCAGCASRIEKRLGKAPGVGSVHVNFATKVATVKYDPSKTTPVALGRAVEDLGYRAVVPERAPRPAQEHAGHDHSPSGGDRSAHGHDEHAAHMDVGEGEARELLRRTVVGAILSVPVLVIAMSHGSIEWINVPWINWLQLALTTPVMFWCGARFFRSALKGARHFSANMDTLVALGTGAAYLYSVAATVWPAFFAGATRGPGPGESHGEHPVAAMGGMVMVPVYYEAAAVIIVLILLGKYLEARATGRTSAAIRRLIGMQPATARVIRAGVPRPRCGSRPWSSGTRC